MQPPHRYEGCPALHDPAPPESARDAASHDPAPPESTPDAASHDPAVPESAPDAGRSRRSTWIWLGYWSVLFVATHVPTGGVKLPVSGGDKVLHGLAFFVLALLGGRAAQERGQRLTPTWVIVWLGVYLLYGAIDELLQALIGRTASVADWVADGAGALAATLIVYLHGGARDARRDPLDESPRFH